MELIDIATGGAVILTVPLLVKAVVNLLRYAETRTPPPRGTRKQRAEARSG